MGPPLEPVIGPRMRGPVGGEDRSTDKGIRSDLVRLFELELRLNRRRPPADQSFQIDQVRLSFPPCMLEAANSASRMREDIGEPIKACLVGIDAGGNVSPRIGAPDHHDAHHTAPKTRHIFL